MNHSGLLIAATALLSILTGLAVVAVAMLGYLIVQVNDLKAVVMARQLKGNTQS